MSKRKRKPKNGYCISCGTALKRPPAFKGSCTIRCAAWAWYYLQDAGGRYGLEGEYCDLCGEGVEMCQCEEKQWEPYVSYEDSEEEE
jgi:hypothetical protein